MRICIISPYPPENDGVGEYAKYLIRSMSKIEKSEIHLLARIINGQQEYKQGNIRITRIWNMTGLIPSIKSVFNLTRNILSIKPQVINLQYGATREYGGTVGEPFFFLFLILRFFVRAKIVISMHTFWIPKESEQRAYELTKSKTAAKLYSYYYQIFMKLFLKTSNSIINVVMHKSPLTLYLRSFASQKNVVEFVHGIPEIENLFSQKPLSWINKKVILLFGNIREDKGYEKVINAIEIICHSKPELKSLIRVVIAGSPVTRDEWAYLDYLKAKVNSSKLSDIISFDIEFLPDDKIMTYFSSAYMTILPNIRRVGPSGVLSLAIAFELPAIVTTDIKYINSNAELPVIEADDSTLADQVVDLIFNEHKRERLVWKIQQYKSKYSMAVIANSHVSLFESLIE